ncbi:MAG TPA: DNA internalization-related competence protein ComEC/Rec2, partial [Gammaproteobacteria bacterium]
MRTGSVLFLLGILLVCRLEELPPAWFCVCLFLSLPLVTTSRCRPSAWLIGGFLWAALRGGLILSEELDPGLEGRALAVKGRVASLPDIEQGRVRFEFDVDASAVEAGTAVRIPRRVRLSWYRDAPRVEPGDEWALAVRLRRPVGFLNPGGFDYEGWLFQQRIRATGHVTGGELLRPGAGGFDVDRLRLWLRERILERFPERRRAALLTALAVGDSAGVAAPDWSVLTRTGTSHLLAISGLHIALVAAIGFALVRRLWPIMGRASLWLPAPRAGAIAATVAAAIYSALAGFGVPTQRALIMVLAWTVASGFCRRTGFTFVLAAALLAVLVYDPYAVLSPGFWLSFGAVAVIGFGMGARTGNGDWWRRWGRVHLIVGVGLLPVLVYWFHQLPVLTVPANLVAVPWISLLTVPLVLLACLVLPLHAQGGNALLDLALVSMDLLWPFLRLLAETRISVLSSPESGLPAVMLALLGAAILMLPRGVPGRWLGVCWMLPLLVPAAGPPGDGEFRLAVLDVGQGLAVVVRTREHVLLYDTGPRFGPGFSAGSAVILPWLRQAGIDRIDVLTLSHGDSDHAGGLSDVRDGIPVDRILSGTPESVPLPVEACAAGQRWRWDGVEFEVLHPAAA